MNTAVMDLETKISGLFDYLTNEAIDAALGADLPLFGNLLGTLAQNGLPFLDSLQTQLFAKLDLLDDLATPTTIAAAINSLSASGITAFANGPLISIHLGAADTMTLAQNDFSMSVGSTALGFSAAGDANLALDFATDLLLSYNSDDHSLRTGIGSKDVTLTLTGDLNLTGDGNLGFLGVHLGDNITAIKTPNEHELALKFGIDIADDKLANSLGAADVTTRASGTADLDLHLNTVLPSELLPTLSTDLVVHYDILNYDPVGGVSGAGSTPNIALENITLNLGSFVDFLAGVFGPIINQVFGAFPIAPVIDVLTTPIPIIDPALQALGLASYFDKVGDDGVINLLDIAAQFGGDPEVLNAFATAFNLIKGIEGLTNSDNSFEVALGSITLLGDAPMDPNAPNMNKTPVSSGAVFHNLLGNPLDTAAAHAGNLGDAPKTDGLGGALKPLTDVLTSVGISIPLLEHPEGIVNLLVNGAGGGDAVTLIEYDVPALTFRAHYENFFPIIGPIGIGIGGTLEAGVDVNFGYDTKAIADGTSFEHGFYFNTPVLTDDNGNNTSQTIDGIDLFFQPVATVGVELDAAAEVNVGFAKLAIGGGVAADLSAFFPNAQIDPGPGPVSGEAGKLRLNSITECLLDPIAGTVKALLFLDFEINFIFFSFMHRFDLADITLAEFSFGCDSPTTSENHGLAVLIAPVADQFGHLSATMLLHGGVYADQLEINGHAQKDTSEAFEIRNAHDGMGNVIPGALTVTSHSINNSYGDSTISVNKITAEMGDKRDVVVIAEDVKVDADISGGDNDDLLVGGAGADLLNGDDGFDHLIGGAGSDTLIGGEGHDVLEGGLGADSIDGGEGFDQASYEHSKAGVVFKPDADDSSVFHGTGGEAQGDTLTSVEYLIGSHFNDILYGNPDDHNSIEGLDGNDILVGGSDDDYLIGGAGADALIGGGNSDGDGTSFLTSAAGVVVNLNTGKGSGGDAEGDTYNGIRHVQGSSSDDVITGVGAGAFDDNIIDGWYGDDQISGGGGGGDDDLRGGYGNDTIYSSFDGDDTLDGGEGHDLLSYERSAQGVDANLYGNGDTDKPFSSGADDKIARVLVSSTKVEGSDPVEYINVYRAHISTFEDLTGSKFADTLIGDDQYNVIRGLAGGDHIEGKGGNDTLIGGSGSLNVGDYLDGGDGIDLADYSESSAGVTVLLSALAGQNGDANLDTLIGIENLLGSDHADTLVGDLGSNEIDPGLTRSTVSDIVIGGGGAGVDTLVLNYSRGGNTKGLVGGYALGSATDGSFSREENASAAQRDGVDFQGIERLVVTGTAHNDIILGGLGNDLITTGSGDDLVFSGLGVDRVLAGNGNDIVVSGTGLDRQFSALGGSQEFELVGGAGIDGLSISLAAVTEDIHLTGTAGTAEFDGVNLVLANGSAASQFEVLLAAATGSGNDVLTQLGKFDNFFATGTGNDEIRAGLGIDTADGGGDYVVGRDITAPDANGIAEPIHLPEDIFVHSIYDLYDNDGDLLVVDYSSVTTAVTSGVTTASTGLIIKDGSITELVFTNNGFVSGGGNLTEYGNIERIDLTGGSGDDILVGTDLLFGRNVIGNGGLAASKSLRGDDRLAGGDGNDLLIGNTGDDTLIGGDGNDLLLGAAIGGERGPVSDLGEIDTLKGGKGADIFVLGTIIGSDRPIIYYNDGTGSAAGLGAPGDRFASGDNRAIITDFEADDHLLIAGVLSDYRTAEVGGSTFLYLRDGQKAGGEAFAGNDELIAELQGVTGFHLDSAQVIFQGDAALSAPIGGRSLIVTSAPVQADVANAHLGSDAAARIAALASASAPLVAKDFHVAAPVSAPVDLQAPHLALPVLESPSNPAPNWVTQTDDPNDLRAALFGANTAISHGILTVEGDASAFGTFAGDPFGLGHGIVLSTGAVTDLAGVNLIDGGKTIGQSVDLHFVKIGRVGINDIYRAELTGVGFDLNSIVLNDDKVGLFGAAGVDSGFDISTVVLSHTRLVSVDNNTKLNDASVLPQIDAFSFDAAHAHFSPGTQRAGDPAGADLSGSKNGLPIFDIAALDTFDSGSLTLGDGGSLGLNLNQAVSTKAPLYLYVAETGLSGETLTTGFKASSSRLDTPADLSTDLGAPGVAGDSTSLTYRFTPLQQLDVASVPDNSITQVTFDFVFFSEELVEYAQTEFNDNFKITLNGVNMALLSDGSSASINTLYAPNASGSASSSIFTLREDKIQSDFIYNPADGGPAASQTRADGYSKVLHFTGNIVAGAENVLRIEVNDVRDGLLDSGILVRGGSFTGHSVNSFAIDPITGPVGEGEHRTVNFGYTVPPGGTAGQPVTFTFHPTAGLDLGAGAGKDVVRIVGAEGHLTDALVVTPLADGLNHGSRFESIGVDVAGRGDLPSVAPLVVEVEDRLVAVNRTIGDAPVRYNRAAPNAWADAWTAHGVHITHTADATARTPAYSAVDFGTANAKLLSGTDIFNGDLGVSGQARGTPGEVQDISGKEALRFEFDSDSVSGFALDFSRFERGDVARIELYDAAGHLVRTDTSAGKSFSLAGLHDIATIIVGANAGAFMIDKLAVTERVDGLVALGLSDHPTPIRIDSFAALGIDHFMRHDGDLLSMHLPIA